MAERSLTAARWLFGDEGDVVADTEAQVIFTANAMLVTGTLLLGPLVSDLAGVFAVSDARAGLLVTVYAAAVAVTLPVAGVVADRIGRKRAAVHGVAVFGLAGAAISLAPSFEAALGLRAVQAAGAAFAKPVLIALLGDLYAGAREATAQSVRVTVDSTFGVVTPVLAGLLFVVSWRSPFLLYLFALPAAGWLWYSLPAPEKADARSLAGYVRELVGVVGDTTLGALMASFVVRMVLMYGLVTYVSVLAVREAGLAVVIVGTLLAVRSLAKIVTTSQVGRLTVRSDPALVTLAGFGLAGIGILLMGAVPIPAVLFGGVIVYGFGDGLLSPAQKSLVNRLVPPAARGGAMAAAYTFQNIGKVLGPLGVGAALAAVGVAPAFVLLGGLGGGAGVVFLLAIWWRLDG